MDQGNFELSGEQVITRRFEEVDGYLCRDLFHLFHEIAGNVCEMREHIPRNKDSSIST